jgi:hypothetical protein
MSKKMKAELKTKQGIPVFIIEKKNNSSFYIFFTAHTCSDTVPVHILYNLPFFGILVQYRPGIKSIRINYPVFKSFTSSKKIYVTILLRVFL